MSLPLSTPDADPESGAPLGVAESLRRVAALSLAQRTMLSALGAAGEPVTATALADEVGVRSSSARETLDALVASGLVRRQRMPVTGPGRPAFGYEAVAPTDTDGPLAMFVDILASTVEVLRTTHPTPAPAAQEIGRAWADSMVGASLPDHAAHDVAAYADLALKDHVDKIAFFFSALGFSATVGADRLRITCRSCPFMRDGVVDGLVCEMHRGMTERVIETTSHGRATAELHPWATRASCDVILREATKP